MRFAIGAALLAVGIAFQMRGMLVFGEIKDEVNRALPAEAQISEFGPSSLRQTVLVAHRRLYPTSNLRRIHFRYWVATSGAFLAAVACFVRFV